MGSRPLRRGTAAASHPVVEEPDQSSRVELTRGELRVLRQAPNEVLHRPEAIEPWEFEAHIGTSPDAARRLMHRLVADA